MMSYFFRYEDTIVYGLQLIMCVISLSGYDVIVYITLSTILYMDQ